MPAFTFSSPDGKTYTVNGPDGATPEQAFALLQKQIGGQQPNSPSEPATAYQSQVLPISKDVEGNLHPAVPGFLKAIGSAASDFLSELPSLPQRVSQQSENLRLMGPEYYNPAPAMEAATLASPVPAAMRAGEKLIPGMAKNISRIAPEVPTAEALKASGAANIEVARQSGLAVVPEAAGKWATKLEQDLLARGIHPVDAQATFAKLESLKNAPSGSTFTAANMQSFRKALQQTAQNFNPNSRADQLAASLAVRDFDRLLPSIAEKDIVAGSPSATHQLFQRGRGDYAAAMRSNAITGELDTARTGIEERAINRAQAANSGRNIDNTIRQKVEAFLEKPKAVSGLTPEEFAALGGVVKGTAPRNTARYTANLMGGGGGVGQSLLSLGGMAAGGYAGNVPGAMIGATVPAALGSGARAIANTLAKRSLRKADELIRKRSPLYQEALRAAETYAPGIEKRAALAKALLISVMTGENR